jgi:5-methylcytosine-specific restriction endonuclease McrA
LPRELGACSTVYDRFRWWESQGVFLHLWQAGLQEYDELAGIGWGYWQSVEHRNWVFSTPEKAQLRTHSTTKIRRHTKVKGTASPYGGKLLYWSQRLKMHPMMHETKAKLLQKQAGKCRWCELQFHDGDLIEIDHITPKSEGGGEELSNKFTLHRHCHDARHAKSVKAETPSTRVEAGIHHT